MNAEKHNYIEYDGLPKEERRKRITEAATKSLEAKRFLLSRNPELKNRIRQLGVVVRKLKKEHPEIISLNLCGSLIKGYANKKSDIDANLLVNINPEGNDALYPYYDTLIRKSLIQDLHLQATQVQHCISIFITEEKITKLTETVCHNGKMRPSRMVR